jgi:hypothetical protein
MILFDEAERFRFSHPSCGIPRVQAADDGRITMQPFPELLDTTLPHSRPKYTNRDLPQIANEDNDADHAQTSKEISLRGSGG